ncbi:MAG: ATPase [Blastopirellula sp.]|nr:ATPase [Blastopirellula sp.]
MSSETPEPYQRLLTQYNELAELAGSLAHEIKNPLSIIRMNMDLLAEDLAEAETPGERRARNKIQVVQDQCKRLETLLNDFLKFARLRDLEMHSGNLNEQVEKVLDFFMPQAIEMKINVIRYLDAELPSILLDSKTLQAALLNLVKNAFEAMPDGGELTVRSYATTSGVALDFIDTGCGMEQTTALKMFDAFYTTKEGGSGLGLSATRKIIEAHGGLIQVQSSVGRGTKFSLQFPRPPRIGSDLDA